MAPTTPANSLVKLRKNCVPMFPLASGEFLHIPSLLGWFGSPDTGNEQLWLSSVQQIGKDRRRYKAATKKRLSFVPSGPGASCSKKLGAL